MTRLDPAQRRIHLIQSGIEWFTTQSYDTLSIAAFAKYSKVSTGLLYHYFENKQAFFVTCQANILAQLEDAMMGSTAMAPMQKFNEGLVAYITLTDELCEVYQTFVGAPGLAVTQTLEQQQQHDTALINWLLGQLGYPQNSTLTLAGIGWMGALRSICMARLKSPEAAPSIINTAAYMQHLLTTQITLAPSILKG